MRSSSRPQAGLKRREIEVANTTRGTGLGTHLRVADNALSRAVGLLGQPCLDSGGGLLIDPSSGIHTFGMRFAIDVIALDRHLRVRGLWENLGPFRIAGLSWKTVCILELPAGVIRDSATRIGDQLEIRR
ncbi:MAG: DUF192 domain-containing protein [Candidatus Korobacteraceae bacterium]